MFVSQKALRGEQNVLATLPTLTLLTEENKKYNLSLHWSPKSGKHLSEVTCLKWKMLSRSLRTWALEKSEELTTSVFMAFLKATQRENHEAGYLEKPQGTDRIYFCINKSYTEEGRLICLGHRAPCSFTAQSFCGNSPGMGGAVALCWGMLKGWLSAEFNSLTTWVEWEAMFHTLLENVFTCFCLLPQLGSGTRPCSMCLWAAW